MSLIVSSSAYLSEEEEDSLHVWKTPRNVCALPLEVSKWGWTKWRYRFARKMILGSVFVFLTLGWDRSRPIRGEV